MNLTEDEQREQYRLLRNLDAFGPSNCVPYISEEGYLQALEAFDRQQERKRWSPYLRAAVELVEQSDLVRVCHGESSNVFLRHGSTLSCGQVSLNKLTTDERATVMRYVRRLLTAI